MKRGDRIQVRAYPDKILDRILWDEYPTWVMVCRPEVYREAAANHRKEPASWMGFPKEDVIACVPGS